MPHSNENLLRKQDPEIGIEKRVVYLSIAGIGCMNCAGRIQNALMRVQGVSEVIIDQHIGLGEVTYNPNSVSDAVLVQTVKEAGNDGHHHYAAELIAFGD